MQKSRFQIDRHWDYYIEMGERCLGPTQLTMECPSPRLSTCPQNYKFTNSIFRTECIIESDEGKYFIVFGDLC